MKSSTYRTVAALLGIGSFLVFASGPSPRTIARTATNLSPSARTRSSQSGTRTPAQLAETYGKVPLSFEANRGQTDPRVKFLSRGSGYLLFLTPTEAVLTLTKTDARAKGPISGKATPAESEKRAGTVVRMKLLDANPAPRVTRVEEQ